MGRLPFCLIDQREQAVAGLRKGDIPGIEAA